MNMMNTRGRLNRHPRKHLAALMAFAPDHEIRATIHLLIEALDARQPDPDLEPEHDRCEAGDDHMIAGPAYNREQWDRYCAHTGTEPGNDDDAEPMDRRGAARITWGRDQRRPHGAPHADPGAYV